MCSSIILSLLAITISSMSTTGRVIVSQDAQDIELYQDFITWMRTHGEKFEVSNLPLKQSAVIASI